METISSDDLLTAHDRIQLFIAALPALTDNELRSLAEDACPICLVPFAALDDSSIEKTVTKLTECGHVFCRKDLIEWIRGRHGSCPTCRHPFLNVRPVSESDDESSDGGEYMPNSDFEDEDEGFLDTDGFSDADAEDYDPDAYNDVWDAEDHLALINDVYEDVADFDEDVEIEQDGCGEWGVAEGDSASMSDLGISASSEEGSDGSVASYIC